MITGHKRGNETYYDEEAQISRYVEDDVSTKEEERPCVRCGKMPIDIIRETGKGIDACLGYIPGVFSACCGHGVTDPIMIYEEEAFE